jgi:succinylglutamic semialdehyde dehydrogenase
MRHEDTVGSPADLISGAWKPIPGHALVSHDPSHASRVVWSGSPRVDHAEEAIASARAALEPWQRLGPERRTRVLRRFQQLAREREGDAAAVLSREVGKAPWDARSEAQLLAAKVDNTLDASPSGPMRRVEGFHAPLSPTRTGVCRFRPHGVMAVIGPFNFPMHLPNGHIVPALAAGNTVVFKPSDKAPASGQFLATLFDQALRDEGAPMGVFNLVHGGADVARRLTSPRAHIDGVLFTGSWPVGRSIMHDSLDAPGRILALEMGGNSAAVIMPDADLRQAVIECVRSAFVGAGQRCTCTRRLVVHEDVAQRVINAVVATAAALRVGPPDSSPEPFMGPLISRAALEQVLDAQHLASAKGGQQLLACRHLDTHPEGHFLSPGVMRMEKFSTGDSLTHDAGADVEVFGPFLRVCVVKSLDEAIEQANATRFGLAASIFTHDHGTQERFMLEARAGCVNINTGTAGASGKLPFGGLGLSGNHRPAGSFSPDYCAFPVASLVETSGEATMPPGMTIEQSWFS